MRYLILALLLVACTPTSVAPSSTPELTPSPTATVTPVATPDAALGAVCAALAEMRQTGTLVTIAGGSLDGDYELDWTPAATALLDQMGTALEAVTAVPNGGPYLSWKQEALHIIVELSTVVERWETGMATSDAAAISEGTDHMAIATGHVDTMNELANAFEGRC